MALDSNNNINHQSIRSQQSNLLINFANQNPNHLNQPITNLNLDDQWHYLDEEKKQSSKGALVIYSNSITCIQLTTPENYWQYVNQKPHYKNHLTEKNNLILNLNLKSIFIHGNSLLGVI